MTCSSTTGATICIVYGMNQTVISDGVLAIATFTISPSAPTSTTPIQVTAVVAASASGTAISGSGQAGSIAVSQTVSSAPSVSSVSPASGTGASVTLTAQFSDTAGVAALASATLLVNNSTSPNNACQVTYSLSTNQFALADNIASSGSTLVNPGGGNASNQQCTLSGSGSYVIKSGNVLTVVVSLLFQSGFITGNETVYLSAVDNNGNTTGLVPTGTWIVTPAPPQPTAVSVSPNNSGRLQPDVQLRFPIRRRLKTSPGWRCCSSTSIGFANSCYIIVDRNAGTIALAYDSALGASSQPIGSAALLQNSQCTVAATSVTLSGLSVTISASVTFPAAFDGLKNIYMFGSESGIYTTGWVQMGAYTVSAGGAPVANSTSPSLGTGSSQHFSFTVSDQGGAGFLTGVSALISSSLSTANACYVLYDRTANTISLAYDNSSNGASPVTPGGNQVVSNSQCTLRGYDSTVVVGANTLVMTVDLTFNPGYAGGKNIYLNAIERTVTSGWAAVGTWTVTGDTPSANSVNPATGAGLSSSFTFTVSDSLSASNISSMGMLITSGVPTNTASACYLVYSPANATISLYNDAGTVASSKPIGSSATLSNSQCAVGYTVGYPSGNSVLFTVDVVFTAAFNGAKSVYLDAIESASSSGWATVGTWTADGDVPVANSVSPATGAGLSPGFTFIVSDSVSASNISSMGMLIASGVPTNTANACYLVYNPANATISLYNDAGTVASWKPIGSSTTLSNSQCAVGYTVGYPSGNSVVFTIDLVFTAAFNGAKSVYLDAIESASSSGWTSVGAWTVP